MNEVSARMKVITFQWPFIAQVKCSLYFSADGQCFRLFPTFSFNFHMVLDLTLACLCLFNTSPTRKFVNRFSSFRASSLFFATSFLTSPLVASFTDDRFSLVIDILSYSSSRLLLILALVLAPVHQKTSVATSSFAATNLSPLVLLHFLLRSLYCMNRYVVRRFMKLSVIAGSDLLVGKSSQTILIKKKRRLVRLIFQPRYCVLDGMF